MIGIIGFILVILFMMEIITIGVYGSWISKEEQEVFMDLEESKLELNQFNNKILSTRPYITNVPFSIFCKYYIDGRGIVPKWYKLHKRINEYFIIATKNELQEFSKQVKNNN